MHPSQRPPRLAPAALALGVALVSATIAPAQTTSPTGATPATGSGAGTGFGAGNSPGRTQRESPTAPGVGTPDPLPDQPGGRDANRLPVLPSQDPRISGDRAPGPRTPTDLGGAPTFPTDATGPRLGIPRGMDRGSARLSDPAKVRAVEARLLEDARSIGDPADRALAFDRTARAYMLTDNWDGSLEAIEQGGAAALAVADPIVRDIRLMSLVSTTITLAQEIAQEVVARDDFMPAFGDQPPKTLEGRLKNLERSNRVTALGGRLAAAIGNDNYASYSGSQLGQAQAVNSEGVARFAAAGLATGAAELRAEATAMLRTSEQVAWSLALPVWRDQTLVRIVAAASNSGQFEEAGRIARRIPMAEARADAQIRLAESLARARQAAEATAVYQEAVNSLVSIPLDDVRSTLGAVLLDSLLAVGRFDDARATSRLITRPELRLRALAAVARSMGGRGMADEALAWIDQEAEPGVRDRLKRSVNEGLVLWLERNRPGPTDVDNIPDILDPGQLERLLPRFQGDNVDQAVP